MNTSASTRLWFRDRHRLSKSREFQAVFEARVSSRQGPLTVFVLGNDLGHPRLGLSIGRRVGGAVRRNAVKRRIREAFRLSQHEFGGGFDIVVSARRHGEAGMETYRRWLADGFRQATRRWERQRSRGDSDG